MSRKTYEERENEIIDVAMQLFYTRTYEQTSVQDIIDTIGIAKGTFYHYFKSKEELLDAIIQRTVIQASEQAVKQSALIEGNALDKLYGLFNQFTLFDMNNREIFWELIEPLFSMDNLRLLYEMHEASVIYITPILREIIQQGIKEGVFDTPYIDEISIIIMNMHADMFIRFGKLLLQYRDDPSLPDRAIRAVEVHEHCVERVLNAQPGTVRLFSKTLIKKFIQGDT